MRVMLAFRVAAPVFAFTGAVIVWLLAGPMAAGFTAAAFLLGVAAAGLGPLKVEAEADEALFGEAEPEALAPAPELRSPRAAPRRTFRCTAQAMAIGSGRGRTGLSDRTAHHALAAAVHACRKREAALRATLRTAPAPPTVTFRQAYAENRATA